MVEVNPDLHPDETEVPRNIRATLEALLNQGIDSREFAPAIKNRRTTEIIDGMHRLEADPTWPITEVDLDPVWERIVRLILNWNRRGMEQPEMTESLDFIAEQTGWTGEQISQNTGIPRSTVYKYLPDKYKRPYKHKGDATTTNVHGETFPDLSGLMSEPNEKPEVTPRHEFSDVRVPDWLQKRFDELDRKRTEEEKAIGGPSEAEAGTETISEDEILTHEELPKESTIEVVLPQKEEEPEPKTPEETLAEIYNELPVPPPTRFLQTALKRDFPGLSNEQIMDVIERTPQPPEPDRLTRIYGFSCPCCGTWKPQSSMQRIVTELMKRDPKLALLVKERLGKQGLLT